MDQVVVSEECYPIGAEEIIVHNEEVVTSQEVVSTQPVMQMMEPVQQNHVQLQQFQVQQYQQQPQQQQLQQVYNIPTLIATQGPIMQVVTLQSVPQQVGLTNTLRNIRLIAIQPKIPFNGNSNGNVQSLPGTSSRPETVTQPQVLHEHVRIKPRPEVKIQPQPSETRKVAVNNFYSRAKPSPPVNKVPQVKPSPSYYREQQREREMKDFSHLNEDLQKGVRIFLDLTISLHNSTTLPFTERVDPIKDGAPDYDQVITKPVWLNLIKDKLKKNEYQTISDFVNDMRLMLENCYRYNGPNHPITKKALRLEQSLEQKLALLPSDLRSQCSLEVDAHTEEEIKSRKQTSGADSFFSVLLHRVRHERQEREQLAKEKKLEEQRLRKEEKERQRCLWAEKMMNPEVKAQMRLMWEIPQVGHFLHLARQALHIGEIAQYELEHMFLMPEASVLLATLMSSLLSSPNQRIKLAESPPTPYNIWASKINNRVAEWYRQYNREGRNFVKIHETLGVEPMFWRVCGDTNPLGPDVFYHQLSFLKRVWIFKSLCDTVAHSHKTVQEAMAEEEGPESREVVLGQDSNGFTYLHFPAVSGSDIRVYRQKQWDLPSDPIWGPLVVERQEQEEERAREEERKLALKKRRKVSVARKVAPKKATSPAPRKKSARTPNITLTPVPKSRKSVSEERPSRIGTRVSPRTLQRQTGLTLYKDTSDEDSQAESEEEEEEVESEQEELEEEDPAEEIEEQVIAATPKATKKRGRKPKKRRPVKKKLTKIVEEDEKDVDEDLEMKDKSEAASPVDQLDGQVKKEEPEDEDSVKKEEPEADNLIKKEVPETENEIKTEDPEKEDLKEEPEADSVKKEEPNSQQKFTVSQLLQKLSTDSSSEKPASPAAKDAAEAEEAPVSQPDTAEPAAAAAAPSVPDPDRCTYDPFLFELIISSVEELLEWINQLSQPGEEDKPRPRCEVKLRDRLQALYDEAQPLAADQLQANQKIGQQLWKEWDRFCHSSAGQPVEGSDSDGDERHSDHYESEEEDNLDGDTSDESDDGVRHSRRLRKRRAVAQSSTRSSSPGEDEVPTKSSRKGSYHFDPGWDSDGAPVESKRKANLDPKMKNPHYWIGRRMTRATAAYADSEFPDDSPAKADPPAQPDQKSAAGVQPEPLVDQLRQLRRQQVLLSSNDPKPPGSPPKQANPPKLPKAENGSRTNGSSPAIRLPTKDSKGKTTFVRISNPEAASLLNKIRQNSKPVPNAPPPPEKQVLIQLKDPTKPDQSPMSLDITETLRHAAQQGMLVTSEPRNLAMDFGAHGHYIVNAQLTPAGPKVFSVTPQKMVAAAMAPNGSPASLKSPGQGRVGGNGVISSSVLKSIVGPEAEGARLSVISEGNAKVLTLILTNGETRRLTQTQVEMIRAAARTKKSIGSPS